MRQSMNYRVSWSDLPIELLEKIGKSLETRIDVSRFRSVCQSWRFSVAFSCDPSSPAFPLNIPFILGADRTQRDCSVLTMSVLYRLQLPPSDQNLTAASTSLPRSRISLVRVEEAENGKLRILDPLSGRHLKQVSNFFPEVLNLLNFRVFELGKAYRLQSCYGSYKAVFSSSNPNGSSSSTNSAFVVMLVICGVLCYLKLGDENWTIINDLESQLEFEDVIHHDGKFYAVDIRGRAVAVDSNMVVSEIASPLYDESCGKGHRQRLVKSLGDLLLVDRCPFNEVLLFKVFKLNWDTKEWIRVKNLGDQVLLMGDDCSFVVSAQDFDDCKGNCIYVGPNFGVRRGRLSGPENGVFSLENGTYAACTSYGC
ncbi:F-box protein [Quillaja saponaria]|uniref:F-box protein n=1 Tax=Quillaja saponaria TaxID=32244 RepID=A0AAD7PNH3_QUISA|nr:F-box protein [Quillaja saponaria]